MTIKPDQEAMLDKMARDAVESGDEEEIKKAAEFASQMTGEKIDTESLLAAHDLEAYSKANVPGGSKPSKPRPPSYRPYPVDAWPPALRRFIVEASSAINCDPSFIALPLLSMLAGCIGTTRRVKINGSWYEPAVIWAVVIAESGTRKTPAMRAVLKRIRLWQRQAFDEQGAAMERYEADRYIVSDITTEALAPILNNNPRGVLLHRDELAGFIGAFDRYAASGKADEAVWLSIWSCELITVDRKTSGTIHVAQPAVSICGTIQPDIFGRVLNQEHRDSGLAARLLLAMLPRRPGYWTDAEISAEVEEGLSKIVDELLKLGHQTDQYGHLQPIDIALTPAAKQRFIRRHDSHENQALDTTGHLAAAFAKMRGYAARVGLVMHLARAAAGESVGDSIDEQSVASAIEIIEWHKNEARRINTTLAESEEDRERRRLAEMIRCKGGSVTVRDWQRIRSHKKADDAEAELADLEKAGYGQLAPAPQTGPGRPSTQFTLHPEPNGDDKTPGDEAESAILSVSERSDKESTNDNEVRL